MNTQLALLGEDRGAEFSPCRTWRYRLWRIWDARRPLLVDVGLNPSTADEHDDDPTIRLGIGLAKRGGYGGLMKLNLFALRSTDPRGLNRCGSQATRLGPKNLMWFGAEAADRDVLCTWGAWPRGHVPYAEVAPQIEELQQEAARLLCLGVTKDGDPWHPLYKPRTEPRSWKVVTW